MGYCRQASTVVLLACALATSCGGDADGPSALACQTADSAGVELVMNEWPSTGPVTNRAVGSSPTVSLGGSAMEADESLQLSRIRDATRLSDGRVVVADGGSAQLRVFDAAGTYSGSWGRRGQGPGEFTGLASVAAWRADSVATWDMWQNRVSVFDSAGEYGRSFLLLPGDDSAPRVVDLRPDGMILAMVLPTGSSERVSGPVRGNRNYVLLDDNGHLVRSLGEFPGPEVYLHFEGDALWSWLLPFGRSTFAALWNDQVVVATNDSYEIRSYRTDGTLRGVVRRTHDRAAAPSQADLDAHIEGLLANVPEADRAVQRASAANLPLVDAYPAYGRVKADAHGHLWVEEYRLPGEDHQQWTVYDDQGCIREVVEMPEGLDVLEIGRDYVLGKSADELDVEHVQVWALSGVTP